jgi:hypothetical protein
MSSPIVHEFPYRLNWAYYAMLLPVMFIGNGILVHWALTRGPKPVDFCGMALPPTQFHIAGVVLAGLGVIALVFAIWGLIGAFTHLNRIAFTADSIILPRPNWWGQASGRKEMEVRFEDISSLKIVPFVANTSQLEITHTGGKVGIICDMLSPHDLNMLSDLLSAGVGKAYSAAFATTYCETLGR